MFYPVQNHGEGLILLVFLVLRWGRQYVGRDYGKEEEGSESWCGEMSNEEKWNTKNVVVVLHRPEEVTVHRVHWRRFVCFEWGTFGSLFVSICQSVHVGSCRRLFVKHRGTKGKYCWKYCCCCCCCASCYSCHQRDEGVCFDHDHEHDQWNRLSY